MPKQLTMPINPTSKPSQSLDYNSTQAMTQSPILYLIPVPIAEVAHDACLPSYNKEIICSLSHFIVENVRSARRFLKAVDRSIDIDSLTFYEIGKHTTIEQKASYLQPTLGGHSMGILSEAGCPAIADPGSDIVALAHRQGLSVVPLVGPSSILLALMGSGFNGQGFAFRGYLPIADDERKRAIRELEHRAINLGETQIFIETPYRNERLVDELIKTCKPSTKLCIASALTSPDAILKTQALGEWKGKIPPIHKQPTIFLLGK